MPEMTDDTIKLLIKLLGVDPSAFLHSSASMITDLSKISGQATEASAGIESMSGVLEKLSSKGGRRLDTLREQASNLFHVFTGGRGIVDFVESTTAANVALKNLSDQVGLAPAKIEQYHYALAAVGSDAKNYDSFLKNYQKLTVTDAGRKQLADVSRKLGVSLVNDDGSARGDIMDVLHNSGKFQQLSRATQAVTIELVGGNAALLPLLDNPRYSQIVNAFADGGPTAKQLLQSQKLQEDITVMQARHATVKRLVNADLLPAADGIANTVSWAEKKAPVATARGAEITGAAAVAAGVASVAAGAKQILGKGAIGSALEGAGTFAGRVAPRLLASTAGRAALGVGATLLLPEELSLLAVGAAGAGVGMLASTLIGKVMSSSHAKENNREGDAANSMNRAQPRAADASVGAGLRRHQAYLSAIGIDLDGGSTNLAPQAREWARSRNSPQDIDIIQPSDASILWRNDPGRIGLGLDAAWSRRGFSLENIFNINVGDIIVTSQSMDPAAVAQDVNREFTNNLVSSLDQFSHALVRHDNGGIY